MSKTYVETPSNFNLIGKYLVLEKDKVVDEITGEHELYFYDTCSIMTHAATNSRSYIINYLKSKNVLIVITRTVLMELCSGINNELKPEHIHYIEEISQAGLVIVLLDEEMVLDCLLNAIDINIEEANTLLTHAVREMNKASYTISELKDPDSQGIMHKLLSGNVGKREMYTSFFHYARSCKESGDDLGEELMFICFIVLTRVGILEKCIFFSNDLKCLRKIVPLIGYIEKHHDKKDPYQLTTASLVYKMYVDGILSDPDKMINILECATNEDITAFYFGEYSIEKMQGSFEKNILINRILTDPHFVVVY